MKLKYLPPNAPYSVSRSLRYRSVLLWGAGRFFEKKTLMVKGSDRVATAALLAFDREYILWAVRSALKNRDRPTILIRMITVR